MQRSGAVRLPMHSGKAPAWLFSRMVKLSLQIIEIIVSEFGREEFLKRLADPLWFQALGSVLGFDWHSSGLTTTTTAAIKQALDTIGKDIGIFAAGGKGKYALETPNHISNAVEKLNLSSNLLNLTYISRLVAKIDNTLIQDGYTLYHHSIFFTKDGKWTVIQQGMNTANRYARRYHWISVIRNNKDKELGRLIDNPTDTIIGVLKHPMVLNLTGKQSSNTRQIIIELLQNPKTLIKEYSKIFDKKVFPRREPIIPSLDILPKNFAKIILSTYERVPSNFKDLALQKGIGPKTFRALALMGELIYGVKADWEDPVKFTYAHGGKDGYPYPINLKDYDKSIAIMEQLAFKLKDKKARNQAVRVLNYWQQV